MIFVANKPDTLAAWALARCIRLARRLLLLLFSKPRGTG